MDRTRPELGSFVVKARTFITASIAESGFANGSALVMSRRTALPPANSAHLFVDGSFQSVMGIIGAVFFYVFPAPEENNAAMADVREKLATIVTCLAATRDNIVVFSTMSCSLDDCSDTL